ncbi:MAG: hypothetical protein RBT65_12800 [Methanolobus sp.]|nr:hypothetical protein [Methanolobus sp.]
MGGQVINQKKLILPLIVAFIIFVIVVTINALDPLDRMFGGHGRNFEAIITILIFPVVPIIYGWFTEDDTGAVIVGIVPIVSFLFYGNFVYGNFVLGDKSRILDVTTYAVSLASVGGLGGYFASKRRIEYLFIAICLCVLWILVFFTGID